MVMPAVARRPQYFDRSCMISSFDLDFVYNHHMTKSKIFVDGNCIVCSLEISHYKRIAPELFELVDISDPQFNAAAYKLDAKSVQKEMHVLTDDGKLIKGVDAFAHIWSRIPKYQFASRAIKLPVIRSFANVGYFVFAELRPLLPKKNR
jgi:predicted DCC family thiol-disulfide oxidoreductase YuxK